MTSTRSIRKHPPGNPHLQCPHFGICGGCAYLDRPYEESRQIKTAQVRSLLEPALSLQSAPYVWEDTLMSPVLYGYRNKMEFTFGDAYKDGPLALGMHKKRSFHDIVSVTQCLLVDEDYRRVLNTTLAYFSPLYEQKKISFYHRKRNEGYLRHLLVRKALRTGEILIDLVTTGTFFADGAVTEAEVLSGYVDALQSVSFDGQIKGILHTKNDAVADAIIDQGTEVLYGEMSFTEELCGLKFEVTPFSFFQTNTGGAELIYETVRRYVRYALSKDADNGVDLLTKDTDAPVTKVPGDAAANDTQRIGTVYDLYSGTGTITQLMASVAERAVGVEIVEEAVKAAVRSARENGIDNCRFIAGDVLKVLDELTDKPDLIILDPPRDGVHPKALKKIVAYGVPHLIYVSCKPSSLARDLPIMREAGYEVTHLVVIDSFCWTKHVETVVRLSQKHIDHTIRVELDIDELEDITV